MGHQRKKNPNVQAIVNPSDPIFDPRLLQWQRLYQRHGDVLRQYKIENGARRPGCRIERDLRLSWRNLSISADGSSDGIVWSLENSGSRTVPGAAVLHAYNAANVGQELYNSNQAGTRDEPGNAVNSPFPRSPTARSTWGRRPA